MTHRRDTLGALLRNESVVFHGAAESEQPTGVAEDSREVTPGTVFIARPGASFDGRAFIDAARAKGASVVLTDAETALPLDGPVVAAEDPLDVGARLAHALAGDPSHGMMVCGVTGTNGKSTCAVLLQHLAQAVGHRCGLIGGIDTFDGAISEPASLTTPTACTLARLFSTMRDNGCSHAAVEASSQGIATGRLIGTHMAVGIFTNLSGDHLDLHGDLDTYGRIKRGWMESLPLDAPRIVNIDDAFGAAMAVALPGTVITCGERGDATVDITSASLDGQQLVLRTPWGTAHTSLGLVGSYNAMNALQAVVASCATGCDLGGAAEALATAPTPRGRLQRVRVAGGGPRVFVDFAHTDGALDAMLASVRPLVPVDGRLILVFGCGGDRDRTKRPRMAAVASRWAHVLWLTSDNPRTEDPEAILDDLEAGLPAGHAGQVHREADRALAIQGAITGAGSEDVVIIAGKGHEQVQLVGDVSVPFDDMDVARAALIGVDA